MVARTPAHLVHAPALATTFGELVSALFEAFEEEYGDEELAALATSAVLQERFAEHAFELAELEAA